MENQPSDELGSENLETFKRIPPPVGFLPSSQKDLSVVLSRRSGSSSMHGVFDGARSDKYVKNTDKINGKLLLTRKSSEPVLYGNSDEQVLQSSEVEELRARLKSLEEENEIIKKELLEDVRERTVLMNYVRQVFRMISCRLHGQDNEENGEEEDYQPWKCN